MNNLAFFTYYFTMIKYKIIAVLNIVILMLVFSVIERKSLKETIHNFNPITICVDPGHGGKDGGAIYNGINEKDINLEIGILLKDVLEEMGYMVVLTRDDDYHLPKGGTYTKVTDLNERIKIIEESQAYLVISIHANKFESSSVHGAQTFYNSRSRDSMVLASLIQKNLNENIENNNRISKSIDTIYMLNYLKIPSVIVESGFMSNSIDLKNITNPDFQYKFASLIASSINEYLMYF